MHAKQKYLRAIPAVDELLQMDEITRLLDLYPRTVVTEALRLATGRLRQYILNTDEESLDSIGDMRSKVVQLARQRVEEEMAPRLRPVINATGVVLHTNLGRAVLSKEAQQAIAAMAANYTNLEFDLSTGKRGSRYSHVEELLCTLTGAEAGMVVNNNAAAVLLALNTMAAGKEVIVSRGQLVEIGGSFRVPDVMTRSGARLVEVGTTNKTYIRDYEQAITPATGLLLRVHPSNYRIIGFTAEVALEELVELGKKYNLPTMDDLGSGVLIDLSKYGVFDEPTVAMSVKAGVDLVTFSGDKLLGGPQAGIIVGKKIYIDQIKKNPLTRALRIDKLTLAGLEATLKAYLDEARAIRTIPTLRMLTRGPDELAAQAESLAGRLREIFVEDEVSVQDGFSQVGGGALPNTNLPSKLVAVKPREISVNSLETELRKTNPPVIARIANDSLLFDVRTVLPGEEEQIVRACREVRTNIEHKLVKA